MFFLLKTFIYRSSQVYLQKINKNMLMYFKLSKHEDILFGVVILAKHVCVCVLVQADMSHLLLTAMYK